MEYDTVIAKNRPDLKIQCQFCPAEWTVEQMYRERPVRNVTEHGLYCQKCGRMVHLYFMNDELEEDRKRLDKVVGEFEQQKTAKNQERLKVARKVYKRKFEDFQNRTRKKLGLPSGRIVWQRPAKEVEDVGSGRSI